MSENDIYRWFHVHTDYTEVIRSIETTSKTPLEIAEHTGIDIRRVADALEKLERSKAVVYQDGKWKATDLAIKVLMKYYG